MPSSTARGTVSTSIAPTEGAISRQHQNEINRQIRIDSSGYAVSHEYPTPVSSTVPDEPPRFTINLSLPPEQRYLEVCTAFKDEIQDLPPLFDEVVGGMTDYLRRKWIHRLSRTFLRRVYDREENAELRGISNATGVPMYLLVCFNVLLDLFMGCSSGGAVVRDGARGQDTKMLHFRTLDWGMPSLRRVVVQLDFTTETDGPIIASSVTYAGYVGVLTGVRQGFSESLNFRPTRLNKGSFWDDARYSWHLLMVLLGRRRSISSELRRFLLPKRSTRHILTSKRQHSTWTFIDYASVVKEVGGSGQTGNALATTACYLCFSDGETTTVVEKDRITATVRSSKDFIVVTNNDFDAEHERSATQNEQPDFVEALAGIVVDEAKDRRQCAEQNYYNMQAERVKTGSGRTSRQIELRRRALGDNDIIEMVQKYPTTNETTHFACVLDPKGGSVLWCRRWMEPLGARWIRDHMSATW